MILVLSDIHGNLPALKSVLAKERGNFTQIWFLGDVAGYGPQCEACYQMLKKLNAQMILGNHDAGAAGMLEMDWFSNDARIALQTIQISKQMQNELSALPLSVELQSVTLFHGSLGTNSWHYLTDEASVHAEFLRLQTSTGLYGHTHVSALHRFSSGTVSSTQPECNTWYDLRGNMTLANPGSVGQPRDSDTRAAYMLFDPTTRRIMFKRCTYPIRLTQRKIRAAGLPDYLATRLGIGA